MHALLLLYKLQARAMFRRTLRGGRTAKGALMILFGAAVVGFWLWSILLTQAGPRTDPALVTDAAPVLLLAACMLAVVTSGGEKAIAFTPAEVDFLFPGPFTRRQLLAYKIGKALAGILFSAALVTAVLLRHAAAWPQAYAALALAMLFLQLFSMAVTLLAQSAGQRAYTLGRKLALAAVIVAVAAAVVPHLRAGGRAGFLEIARALRGSRAGAVVLAPLDAFGQLFVAAAWWPAGLKHLALAAAVDGLLLLVVFYLDADYLEAAAARSQALYERLRRVRKGGITAIGAPGRRARGALPMFPQWRGAGPVAWRQATTALRNGRGLLFVLLILAVAVGPILASASADKDPAGPAIGAMAWLTVIVGAWLRFDFRGDLDQIDYLKSLPTPAWALAAGQVATPAALMTLCHWLIVAGVSVAVGRVDPMLLAAAWVALPFNVLLFEIENVIFLLFPTRAAANPADFAGYGRQVLTMVVKVGLILFAAGLAALAGLAAHLCTGSLIATIAAATVTLAALAAATLPVVAWAFRRFDVAGEMPA